MKTLKLQVGKTYRSREGEEVKIVGMGNKGWDYWEGSNGEWYYEGGKWSCVTKEHPEDLIEEVTEPTRHTFDVPDGVKKVTVEQVGNRIVVEMALEKEPKPGDISRGANTVQYTMENIKEQFARLYMELDLTDDQAAMIKKLQRDVDAALRQPPISANGRG